MPTETLSAAATALEEAPANSSLAGEVHHGCHVRPQDSQQKQLVPPQLAADELTALVQESARLRKFRGIVLNFDPEAGYVVAVLLVL